MKRIFLGFMIITAAMTMLVTEAQAARFGGGFRSFGKTSSFRSYRAPTQKAAPTSGTKPAAGATARQPSRWGGMFGGLLLGMGLGALLGHFGISGGLASMISTLLMFGLIGFGVMFLFRRMAQKQMANQYQNHQQYSSNDDAYQRGYSNFDVPEIGSGIERRSPSLAYSNGQATDAPYGVPAGFDTETFLRSAKTYFIRLQAAWDKSDIEDIREYTTPEMFGELRMQLHERGEAANHTDVVTLDAELLGMENIANNEQMASVLFSGTIREALNGPAGPFSEIWNLTRPLSENGGWVVAGIQQT